MQIRVKRRQKPGIISLFPDSLSTVSFSLISLFVAALVCSPLGAGASEERDPSAAPPHGARGYHSAAHPFEAPTLSTAQYQPPFLLRAGGGMALAIAPVKRPTPALYATGVNYIRCSLAVSQQTWLGTAFGIKRLDPAKRTVQHYTMLDGLPYPAITALAANESRVFCTAARFPQTPLPYVEKELKPAPSMAALCEFDPGHNRWKTLVNEPLAPYDLDPRSSSLPNGLAPHPWAVANHSLACLVPGTGKPDGTLALLVSLTKGTIQRLLTPKFIKKPLVVTTARIDSRYLWLGTQDALLRYDLKANNWQTLLPDMTVYSSVSAKDGSLWITGSAASSHTVKAERFFDSKPEAQWSIVHLVNGLPVRTFSLPSAPTRQRNGSYESLTIVEGKLWWSLRQQVTFHLGHTNTIVFPSLYSLDPATGQVETEVDGSKASLQEYAKVPTFLLANSFTDEGIDVPAMMPERFPGWFCHEEAVNKFMILPAVWTVGDQKWEPEPSALETIGKERSERSRWAMAGISDGLRSGNFLVYAGAQTEYYDPPTPPTPIVQAAVSPAAPEYQSLQVEAVDKSGVWLSVSSQHACGVARFDRQTHTWKFWTAASGLPPNTQRPEFTADGHTCWLRYNTDRLYRLNTTTDRWENISARLAGGQGEVPFRQVLVAGTEVWLIPGKSTRWYAIEGEEKIATQPPAPLYHSPSGGEDSSPDVVLTAVYPTPGKALIVQSLVVSENSLLLAASQGAYRLDRPSEHWQPIRQPTLPASFPHFTPTFVREAKENVWIFGDNYALRFPNR